MTLRQYVRKISNRRKFLVVGLTICILLSVFCIGNLVGAAERNGYCNATDVNIRSGPSTGYASLGKADYGDSMVVHSETRDGNGDVWYNITVKGITGYMHGEYVTIIGNVPEYSYDGDFESYMNSQGFPESYKPYLRNLHAKYPNWVFVADKLNLTWADAVAQESYTGRSLVPVNSYDSWKSTAAGAYEWSNNTWIKYDSGQWVCASNEIVSYYMDPRNSLDETNIFQFESLAYNASTHKIDGVNTIVKGTFMDASKSVEGTNYPNIIMSAASQTGVSPFYLATSIIGEQGTSGTSGLISGNYPGYAGYYNFFNYGASAGAGGTSADVIKNGLEYAKNQGWNSRTKSIVGGAKIFADGYINAGQNTLYYKKFNVVNQVWWHQYMTAIHGSKSEASTLSKAYSQDLKNTLPITFKIPVYKNMPDAVCQAPATNGNPNYMLKSLSINGYSLTPSFNYNTTYYTLTVPSGTSQITVNAAPVASTSSVSGAGNVNLNYGDNTIKVTCTAQNGTSRTYTITVVRLNATNPGGNTGGNTGGQTGGNTGQTASVKVSYPTSKAAGATVITGINPGSDVAKIKSGVVTTNGYTKVYNASGQEMTSGRVGTGCVVKSFDNAGKLVGSYTVVIYGDVNGDGEINSRDILEMRRDMFGYVNLSDIARIASDINKSGGRVDSRDILEVRRHVLGYVNLSQ